MNCLGTPTPRGSGRDRPGAHAGPSSNLYYRSPTRSWRSSCARSRHGGGLLRQLRRRGQRGQIKLARKYASERSGEGRGTIITLNNSFHGRTITTWPPPARTCSTTTSSPSPRASATPTPTIWPVRQGHGRDDVCAIMMELVQGEGGVLPLEQEFVQGLAELCARRTGCSWSTRSRSASAAPASSSRFQHYGIQPDTCSLAKGSAGGLPMGALPGRREVPGRPHPRHPRLHLRGNPVCCRRRAGGAKLDDAAS